MYVFSHLLINCVLAFVGESYVLIAIVLVFVFIHSVLAFVGLLEYNLLIAIVLAFGRRLDGKVHTTLSVGACVGACSDVEGPRILHFELVAMRFFYVKFAH